MPPVKASGVLSLNVDAGRHSAHTNNILELTLDELVSATLTGIGGGATGVVTSDALSVRRFWIRFILTVLETQAAAAAEAHRTRKVHPILKAPKKGTTGRPAEARPPEGKAVCPRCGNRPGEVEVCRMCDARGLVDKGVSEWLDV